MKKMPKYRVLNGLASLIIFLSLIIAVKLTNPSSLMLGFLLFVAGFLMLSIAQHEEDEYKKCE